MIYYVNQAMLHDGDGSLGTPFRRISEAAKIAKPGDEVLVFPGVYREYVNPERGGTEDAPILYRSIEPLGAVICGAERIKGWTPYQGTVWTVRVKNSTFGAYNPYTTEVFGDWYFAPTVRHTGAVYLNDQMLYEAESLEECIAGEIYKPSWDPQGSTFKWFSEQNGDETVLYANFHTQDPNREKVEINVRRRCFFPEKTGCGYITVHGFKIEKAATTWAPPAAFQDGMIGPHWSKGWIIEDCEQQVLRYFAGQILRPGKRPLLHEKAPQKPDADGARRGLPRAVSRLAEGKHRQPHHPPLQHPQLRADGHRRTYGRGLFRD